MNSTVTIRRMNIEDLDAIQSLYALQTESDDNPLTSLRISARQHAWEMRRLRQQLLTEQKYLAFVATLENEQTHEESMIGYIAAILEQQAHLFKIDTVASIGELWVVEEYRGRGIGEALFEELTRAIHFNGIEWITVHMPASAHEALAFFEKLGFEQKNLELQAHLGRN